MARGSWRQNAIYISARLQACLQPIAYRALTAVVAPMGYGKTTAIAWYLQEQAKKAGAIVLRVNIYSENLAIFWSSVRRAFAHAGFSFLEDYACPEDAAGAGLLAETLCYELGGDRPCYLFIDDLHLLRDARVAEFACQLASRLPENVHLILASRNDFLPGAAILRLGSRVCRIGVAQLRLTETELAAYARRCGAVLTNEEMARLLHVSEGWFSAVYLHLRALAEHGALPVGQGDMTALFFDAMIDPLPPQQQEFLAVMAQADEFTMPMAQAITGAAETQALLAALTAENAFVTQLPDGETYRFHHMLRDCASQAFSRLPQARQRTYLDRYGVWYEARGQYLHALAAYRRSGHFDRMLCVVEADAGILLASVRPEEVLTCLDACPPAALHAHPMAILVLMRCMFNWRRIPEMLALQGQFEAALAAQPSMPPAERDHLLGECDLIRSFLCYNDISAMSRLHASASARMTRPAISIRNSGGWTFGSPSVLMMFHRTPGGLAQEQAEMDACMPHYYKITDGHGRGAEQVMRAEAAFLQGRFCDAQIALEQAYAQVGGNENMALCCDFLAWRLSLCAKAAARRDFASQNALLRRQHNAAWVNLFSATCAYYYALLGLPEKIPALFRLHQLETVHFLAPGKPMMGLIENQVYLAQGAYAKVLGGRDALLGQCQGLHYCLVALHVQIQAAAALTQLGKLDDARVALTSALDLALPDGLLLPFAENHGYLAPLLAAPWPAPYREFLQRVAQLDAVHAARCAALRSADERPAALAALTEREAAIAALIAARCTNREIAAQLCLSEGSVKQYVNQIYAKLQIGGDTRTKRQRLAALQKN